MAFQQGLSGLYAASKALDVTSNNVANSATIGFKSASGHFADVFANSLAGSGAAQVGIGTSVGAVQQQFTQGNITTTNNPLDISISGSGFFRMSDNGTISYSRNGQFHQDKNGFIVDDMSRNLTGYPVGANGTVVQSSPEPIRLDSANQAPVATGQGTGSLKGVQASLNLDSRSTVKPLAFDMANPATYNFSTATSIFDTLGNSHTLTIYARKVDSATSIAAAAASAAFTATSTFDTAATAYNTAATNFNTAATTFNTDAAAANDVASAGVAAVSAATAATAAATAATAAATSATAAAAALAAATPATLGTATTAKTAADNAKTAADTAKTSADAAKIAADTAALSPTVANLAAAAAAALTANNDATTAAGLAGAADTAAAAANTVATAANTAAAAAAAANTNSNWSIYTSVDGTAVTNVNGGVPTTLAFNQSGQLIGAPAGGSPLAIDLNAVMAAQGTTNTAGSPLTFNLDFASTTQYGSASGTNTLQQDGYTSGRLTGVSVGDDGVIRGSYSNGQSRDLGQVVLANFTNPNGLTSLGSNQWAETSESGTALVGAPNTGTLGVLQSSAVEESNVDLTTELVNMITEQRNYQANSQSIKTQNDIMQTLVNLR